MLPYYTSLGFRSSVLTKVQQTHKLSSALGIGDCCQAVTRGEVILFASRIENWVIDTEVLPVLVIDASGNKLPVRGCISRTRGCSAFFAFAVLLFRSQRWSRDGSLTTNRGLSSFFFVWVDQLITPRNPFHWGLHVYATTEWNWHLRLQWVLFSEPTVWIGLIFSRHLNVPRYDVYSDQSVNIEGYMSLQSMRWRGWSGNWQIEVNEIWRLVCKTLKRVTSLKYAILCPYWVLKWHGERT